MTLYKDIDFPPHSTSKYWFMELEPVMLKLLEKRNVCYPLKLQLILGQSEDVH